MGAPENNEIVFASEELTSFFLHEKQRSNNSAISLSSFIMFKKKWICRFRYISLKCINEF